MNFTVTKKGDYIIDRLGGCQAYTKATAVSFEQAGITDSKGIRIAAIELMRADIIRLCARARFYLPHGYPGLV